MIKNILDKHFLILSMLLCFVACKQDDLELSNVEMIHDTFFLGIDAKTPYAENFTVSKDAFTTETGVIVSSEPWELEANKDSDAASWCGFYIPGTEDGLTGGLRSGYFTLIINANSNAQDREAKFIFLLKNSNIRKTFVIHQTANDPFIKADSPSMSVLSKASENNTIKIRTNTQWSVTVEPSTATWLTLQSPTQGLGEFDLKVKVDQNTGATRSAMVIIKNNEIADTVKVSQLYPSEAITYSSNLNSPSIYSNAASLSNVISWINPSIVYISQRVVICNMSDDTLRVIDNSKSSALSTLNITSEVNANSGIWLKGYVGAIKISINALDASSKLVASTGVIITNTHYSLGMGTDEDPFIIMNFGQLSRVSKNLNKSFKQGADIDVAVAVNLSTQQLALSPIGEAINPFTGKYDGDGYKIDNLKMVAAQKTLALFGYIKQASISNIILSRCDINNTSSDKTTLLDANDANGNCASGIVGYFTANFGGSVTGCANIDGKVESNTEGVKWPFAAGIVGKISGSISSIGKVERCYNTSEIKAGAWAAGIACLSIPTSGVQGISVRYCYNKGNITSVSGKNSSTKAAGIMCTLTAMADVTNVKLEQCFNTGTITGQSGGLGGIAGQISNVPIKNCFNTGNIVISANFNISCAGGIMGTIGNDVNLCTGSISSCYSVGSIKYATGIDTPENGGSGLAKIGGIVGERGNAVKNPSTDPSTSGYKVLNCKFLEQTTPFPISDAMSPMAMKPFDAVTDKSTWTSYKLSAQTSDALTKPGTYAEWDFVKVWTFGAGYSYPQLLNNLYK